MNVRIKRDLIAALRKRTDELERAFALDDLDQVKALEHLLEANLGALSDIIDQMERQ